MFNFYLITQYLASHIITEHKWEYTPLNNNKKQEINFQGSLSHSTEFIAHEGNIQLPVHLNDCGISRNRQNKVSIGKSVISNIEYCLSGLTLEESNLKKSPLGNNIRNPGFTSLNYQFKDNPMNNRKETFQSLANTPVNTGHQPECNVSPMMSETKTYPRAIRGTRRDYANGDAPFHSLTNVKINPLKLEYYNISSDISTVYPQRTLKHNRSGCFKISKNCSACKLNTGGHYLKGAVKKNMFYGDLEICKNRTKEWVVNHFN